MNTLSSKVALVTGAGRGIGRAIALGLAREGAAVVLVARTLDEIQQVEKEITGAGQRAVAMVADVAEEKDVNASVQAAVDRFGSLDILVNNAGHNHMGSIVDMPSADWWRQIEVNLKGTYLYCKAALPHMLKKKWGRIVNVSSTQGKKGEKFVTAYCSAKHGVIGLTRALALEVADKGITVNAICPGFVKTKLTEGTMAQRAAALGIHDKAEVAKFVEKAIQEHLPQKSAMVPEEMVPSVLFLVSDGANRTTGEALNISGGLVMH